MQYAKILGSGSYLPEKRVSNDDLAEFVDTSDEWIVSRTGIKFRHLAAENERTSDLAVIAAQRALADAGVAAEEIDLIVLATATPDMQFPSTATIVQNKLGIAGFLSKQKTANGRSGHYKRATGRIPEVRCRAGFSRLRRPACCR